MRLSVLAALGVTAFLGIATIDAPNANAAVRDTSIVSGPRGTAVMNRTRGATILKGRRGTAVVGRTRGTTVVSGLPAARGATIVRGILILPMLLTPVVVGLMWRALLNPEWGRFNWLLAKVGVHNVQWLSDPGTALRTLIMVDTWQWTPFVFVVVYARLQALPLDVFEAGEVDGATWFKRLRYLTLPLLMPAIAFAAIFRGIDAFRTFDLVYGLTNGGPVRSTSTLSFQAFQNGFQYFHYGYASAIAYVMVIIAIVGVTVLLRFVRVRREDI